jgi:hypothetical protein
LAIPFTPVNHQLLGFAVNRVFVAEPAELFQLKFVRCMHLILFGVVIALFAFRTRQRNPFTRTWLSHIGTSNNPVKTLVRAKKKTRASDKQKYSSTAGKRCQTPYRSAPQRHTHIVAERAREDFVEIEEPADTEEAKSEEVENRPADSADIKEMGAQGPEKEAEPKGRPAASV